MILQRLEDRYADRLVTHLMPGNSSVMIADTARAWIDLNRAEDDWDWGVRMNPDQAGWRDSGIATPSHRARSGLGLVPTRLFGVGPLWSRELSSEELAFRISYAHRPWHDKIDGFLGRAIANHGAAVLLDIHSMPQQRGGQPQIVIGDRFGASANSELSDTLLAIAEGFGFVAARNAPYAGAHVVARHGAPALNRHALQIEFDRTLYLDDAGKIDSRGLALCRRLVSALASAAERWVHGSSHGGWQAIAAE